jgi:hypothetical protein
MRQTVVNRTGAAMEVISRKDAKARGLTRYFTGKACLKGHVAERFLEDGRCVECRREYDAKRHKTPEVMARKREYLAKWRTTPEGRAMELIAGARRRAKAKGLDFDLDVEWVVERIKRGCAMTGEPFNLTDSPPKGSHAHRKAPSLDRIDNARGYTKDNVWVICAGVNVAKNSMSVDVFWSMCAKVCKTLPALRAAGVI